MIYLVMFIVVILNALCIYLMYRFLKNVDKKEKFIFIAVGVALMYAITIFVQWISTSGLDAMYKEGVGKDIVTFLFVPINGLIVLPALSNSYNSFKQKKLSPAIFAKRITMLLIPFLIVLILECIFIKNAQVSVTNMYIDSTTFKYEEYMQNSTLANETVDNNIGENEVANETATGVVNETTNEITNEVTNEVTNETTNESDTDSEDNSVSENKRKNDTKNKTSNTIKANNTVED